MIRNGLSILILFLVVPGCDDDASQPGADRVTVTEVESEHATCGNLEYSALELTLRNDGDEPITPERIELSIGTARMVSAFAAAIVVPPGATVSFECHGDFTGEARASDPVPSEVVVHYAIAGEAKTAEADGTHQSWLAFDFCDTAFPEIETPDCVVVETTGS